MNDHFGYRMLGFSLIALGATVFFNPILEIGNYPVVIDLTGFNVQSGLIIIGIGSFFVWSTYRKK
jgi:hypothetical protein